MLNVGVIDVLVWAETFCAGGGPPGPPLFFACGGLFGPPPTIHMHKYIFIYQERAETGCIYRRDAKSRNSFLICLRLPEFHFQHPFLNL